MYMEQLNVLNVHGAVACDECAWSSCMCMSSECESDGEHSTTKDTDDTRSYEYTGALHSVEAVWQVGPGAVSVSVVATEDVFLVLC